MSFAGKLKKNAKCALKIFSTQSLIIGITFALICGGGVVASGFLASFLKGDLTTIEQGKITLSQLNALLAEIMLIIAFVVGVVFPLNLGIKRYFYFLSDGYTLKVMEIFFYFREWQRYARVVFIWGIVTLKKLFYSAIMLVFPFLGAIFGVNWYSQAATLREEIFSVSLVVVSVMLFACCGIFAFMFLSRYFFIPYIIIVDDKASLNQTVDQALELTEGRFFEIFYLRLSLIWCNVLNLFWFFRIFTIGYENMVYSLYVRWELQLTGKRFRNRPC